MDVGLTSSYLSEASSNAAEASSKVKDATGRDYSQATDEEMLDACKQFEAYFIEQVLKEVKKTIPKDPFDESTNSTLVDYFKDNMIQDLAADIQETSNLGIAQQMYEQMKRNYSNVVPVPTDNEE